MTYFMRNIINKCCAGIYRKRNRRSHFTNKACSVNTHLYVTDTWRHSRINCKCWCRNKRDSRDNKNRFAYFFCWVEVLIWWYNCDIYNIRCWGMKYVSRDTYQDRLANFTTDTNRAPIINNYLINKIKVTHFYNTIRRATDTLSKHTHITNLRTQTNLRRDLPTALLINLLARTLVQPEKLYTYI